MVQRKPRRASAAKHQLLLYQLLELLQLLLLVIIDKNCVVDFQSSVDDLILGQLRILKKQSRDDGLSFKNSAVVNKSVAFKLEGEITGASVFHGGGWLVLVNPTMFS